MQQKGRSIGASAQYKQSSSVCKEAEKMKIEDRRWKEETDMILEGRGSWDPSPVQGAGPDSGGFDGPVAHSSFILFLWQHSIWGRRLTVIPSVESWGSNAVG